jgi:hypothetical protein
MGHAALGLIAALLGQTAPQHFANRWLVLGKTHARRADAEAQAAEIRKRNTEVEVIATDHYANLVPGRFAIVFLALVDKAEAQRRQRALWTIGHRPWIRWSGAYVANPGKKALRFRKRRLESPAPARAAPR